MCLLTPTGFATFFTGCLVRAGGERVGVGEAKGDGLDSSWDLSVGPVALLEVSIGAAAFMQMSRGAAVFADVLTGAATLMGEGSGRVGFSLGESGGDKTRSARFSKIGRCRAKT